MSRVIEAIFSGTGRSTIVNKTNTRGFNFNCYSQICGEDAIYNMLYITGAADHVKPAVPKGAVILLTLDREGK